MTVEADDRPAITSIRLLAVLTVESKYASSFKRRGAKRRAPLIDGPLMHFASPPDEKCGLDMQATDWGPLLGVPESWEGWRLCRESRAGVVLARSFQVPRAVS